MMGRSTTPYEYEYATMSLNRLRESVGLSAIVEATIRCLRCAQKFRSPDAKKVRMCNNCKRHDDGLDVAEFGGTLMESEE